MGRKFLLGTLKVGLINISRLQKQVFRTRILEKECFFTINSNVDKKCIIFRTEIIFRSGSKDFALVHDTFTSTKNLVLCPFHGGCS